eukprot:1159098-Pelagomonas_calceolata.AAC.2
MKNGANANERGPTGETPLLYIAKEGHYKYPPQEIPQVRDNSSAVQPLQTCLEIAVFSFLPNCSPDCKRLIAQVYDEADGMWYHEEKLCPALYNHSSVLIRSALDGLVADFQGIGVKGIGFKALRQEWKI